MYTANHLKMNVIASLTESGSTVLWMSRISSGIPIFALTPNKDTLSRLTLYRGVYPVRIEYDTIRASQATSDIIKLLKEKGIVEKGNRMLLTRGDLLGKSGGGGTNTMKIVSVE